MFWSTVLHYHRHQLICFCSLCVFTLHTRGVVVGGGFGVGGRRSRPFCTSASASASSSALCQTYCARWCANQACSLHGICMYARSRIAYYYWLRLLLLPCCSHCDRTPAPCSLPVLQMLPTNHTPLLRSTYQHVQRQCIILQDTVFVRASNNNNNSKNKNQRGPSPQRI